MPNLQSFVVVVQRECDRSSHFFRLDHCLKIRQKTHMLRHVRRKNLHNTLHAIYTRVTVTAFRG